MLLEDDNELAPDFFAAVIREFDDSTLCCYTACIQTDGVSPATLWQPSWVTLEPHPRIPLDSKVLLSWAFDCQAKISALVMRNDPELHGLPTFSMSHYFAPDIAALCELFIKARGRTKYIDVPLMTYFENPESMTSSAKRQRIRVIGETLRSLRANIGRLADTNVDKGDWQSYAARVRTDRLMLAALSLYDPIPAPLVEIRTALTAALVARSGELHGRKAALSMRYGNAFWSIARLGLSSTHLVRRWRNPIVDY